MSSLADIIFFLAEASWLFATCLIIIFSVTALLHYKSLVNGKRSIRRALFASIISALTIIHLWLLFEPPILEQQLEEISVLTVGSNEKLIANKIQQASASKPVFVDGIKAKFQSEYIKTLSKQAIMALPNGASVKIYGDGISPEQVNRFPKQHITFLASAAINGISKIQWTKKIQLGNRLTVSGRVTAPHSEPLLIELIDPAGEVAAETKLNGAGFTLSTWPKASGLFHYKILIKDQEHKTIYKELIPVEVTSTEPAKVLIIADAPGFEINRLQRFLENQGTPLVSRIKISKDKYRSNFSSIEEFSFAEQLPLEMFDLLIIDERSFIQLPTDTRQHLNTTINSFGLGVLVLLNELSSQQTLLSNRLLNPWFKLSAQGKIIKTATFRVSESSSTKEVDSIDLSAVSRHFIAQDENNILLQDTEGHTLAIAKNLGNGKVGATRILDSHKLAASIEKLQLSEYWKILIEGLSKAESLSGIVKIQNHLPVLHEELVICKTGNTNNTITITDSTATTIDIETSRTSDNQHCGRYWPMTIGWHQITTDDLLQSFYVFKQNQWQAAKQALKHNQNHDIANASALYQQVKLPTPLPLQWILISLLVLIGITWAEQKF